MFEKLINNKLFKSKDIGHGVIMITDITGVSGYLVMGAERAYLENTCDRIDGKIGNIVYKKASPV